MLGTPGADQVVVRFAGQDVVCRELRDRPGLYVARVPVPQDTLGRDLAVRALLVKGNRATPGDRHGRGRSPSTLDVRRSAPCARMTR